MPPGGSPRAPTIRARTPRIRCGAWVPIASTSTTRTSMTRDTAGGDAGAFNELVQDGKVRHIGASNFTAPGSLRRSIADREGFAPYAALQPHYNLVDRANYEGDWRTVLRPRGPRLCSPSSASPAASSPASTGPGRLTTTQAPASRATLPRTPRTEPCSRSSLEWRAPTTRRCRAVALAWLRGETIAAPIASARTPAQLAELLPSADLRLTSDELAELAAR